LLLVVHDLRRRTDSGEGLAIATIAVSWSTSIVFHRLEEGYVGSLKTADYHLPSFDVRFFYVRFTMNRKRFNNHSSDHTELQLMPKGKKVISVGKLQDRLKY
jgi:hypothetical protein